MRKPKYRVDTFPVSDLDLSGDTSVRVGVVISQPSKQIVFEDRLDEFAEQGWQVVTIFVVGDLLWLVSKRTWWWRLTH